MSSPDRPFGEPSRGADASNLSKKGWRDVMDVRAPALPAQASGCWPRNAAPAQPAAVLRLARFSDPLASDGGASAPRRPAARIFGLLASDGGAPAPRRPAARIFGLLASDGGAPAPRRPAAGIFGLLASDGGAPAPRRPAARTASWGRPRKGGEVPLRVS